MPTTPHEFQNYLDAPEGNRFEFKEAKGGFHFDKLVEYVVALANGGGGKIILGVTDKRPRQTLMRKLKASGLIRKVGELRWARWFPGGSSPSPQSNA